MNTLLPTRTVDHQAADVALTAAERALAACEERTAGDMRFVPDLIALEYEVNGVALPETSAIAFGTRHVRVYLEATT